MSEGNNTTLQLAEMKFIKVAEELSSAMKEFEFWKDNVNYLALQAGIDRKRIESLPDGAKTAVEAIIASAAKSIQKPKGGL